MELTSRATPGLEGMYVVKQGRTLFWVLPDQNSTPWARANSYVDLRSPAVCEYVQKTRQIHKMRRVEKVPADAAVVDYTSGPFRIRKRFSDYEQAHAKDGFGPIPREAAPEKKTGKKTSKKASRSWRRKDDQVGDLPSAAETAELPLDGGDETK